MTLSLSNVIMTSLGGVLSGINLWGYYKCSKDQQSKLKGVRDMVAQKGIMYAMKRWLNDIEFLILKILFFILFSTLRGHYFESYCCFFSDWLLQLILECVSFDHIIIWELFRLRINWISTEMAFSRYINIQRSKI